MEPLHQEAPQKVSLIDTIFRALMTLRPSDALLLKTSILVLLITASVLLIRVSTESSVLIPATGGTLREGILGTPRFANPVLAVTRADKDLSALIYAGLMMPSHDGTLVPNVAESVTVSEDGLTYNVLLRDDVTFHDGAPLSARDVVFTVTRIQDPLLSSPLRANFEDVVIEEIGPHEVNFILREAYAPFIENLTFGILPEHIWKEAGAEELPFSQYNSEPIGAGPYKVVNIKRNASGIPETYFLGANESYHLGAPRISTVELHFYPTEARLRDAFVRKEVESVVGINPLTLSEYTIDESTHHLERIPLPRTFAVFFNQNKSPALRDISARRALEVSINRDELIKTVLGGYGNPLSSPIPYGFGPIGTTSTERGLDQAREILKAGGWKMNDTTHLWEKEIDKSTVTLGFSIATANNSDFEATAEFLRKTWESLGVSVEVKQFEQSDLTQAIIRPRDYEALLFGTDLGRPLDFYSFWHSSQRNDPGLNIALYTNITTDSILAEMRRGGNTEEHEQALTKFATEIEKEIPAIFLYTPELLYLFPNRVTGRPAPKMSELHERFSNIHTWFIETESVWPLFTE